MESELLPSKNDILERRLPLRVATPRKWAKQVLAQPVELLIDHAYLEKKASQNALNLLHQWPEKTPPKRWTEALSEITRDESQHLNLVLRLLHARGGELTRSHRNEYAQALHQLIHNGTTPGELVDKLLVSSLIEARSCERFLLLGEGTDDPQMKKLYTGLWSSEHDHYRVFLELAAFIQHEDTVAQRWDWFLDQEAEIIQSQTSGPRMHSWVDAEA